MANSKDYRLWTQFASRFPIEFCRRNRVLGATNSGGDTCLLATKETKRYVIDNVGRALGTPMTPVLIDGAELDSITNEVYEQAVVATRAAQEAPSLSEFLGEAIPSERADDLLESDTHGATVKLVNDLLLEAIQIGASDLHLQPFEDHVIVRMRQDGVLEDVRKLPRTIQDEVISRLKVAGKMNIAERRLPQDGRATVRVGDRTIDLRLASIPTSYGERIVVRLLDKSARLYQLADIGMDESFDVPKDAN